MADKKVQIPLNEESESFQELKKEWLEKAREQTMDTLPDFLNHLMNDYRHDYGTIVHAMVAGLIATFWAMDREDQIGITGFQASFVMWGFIRNEFYCHNQTGLQLLDFDNLLYPQNIHKVLPNVSSQLKERLKEIASEKIENKKEDMQNGLIAPEVWEHWEKLASGADITKMLRDACINYDFAEEE